MIRLPAPPLFSMPDDDDVLGRMLSELGYDRRWFDFGIVDRALLERQCHSYRQPGGDKNTEHYRAAAIQAYAAARESITDDELARLVEVGHVEATSALGDDVFYRLVQRDFLTDAQLELVGRQSDRPSFQALVHRHRLLRLCRSQPESAELQRCIDDGDAVVHETLLGLATLSRSQVEELARRGANRRIRNMAKQLLESRRFRRRDV